MNLGITHRSQVLGVPSKLWKTPSFIPVWSAASRPSVEGYRMVSVMEDARHDGLPVRRQGQRHGATVLCVSYSFLSLSFTWDQPSLG
jgi:hypothetical protein